MVLANERKITHIRQMRKCKYPIREVWTGARSLARIKVSAFGAGDRGFESHRARHHMYEKVLAFFLFLSFFPKKRMLYTASSQPKGGS